VLIRPSLGDVRRLAGADQFDHFVQMVQGDQQAFQDVRPFFGLPQIVLRAADHHVHAVLHEVLDHGLQAQQPGGLPCTSAMLFTLKLVCSGLNL
jgi:hypothetical protein